MLKFSPANAKTSKLALVPSLAKYLENRRKVYSLDLLSGFTCPFAEKCLSKAVENEDGSRRIKDGPHTEFRCFSASQEVLYTNVYKQRKHNTDVLRKLSTSTMIKMIEDSMPKNLGICRIHVAGDFFNRQYFESWMVVSIKHPDRLFYAYTKSLPYWVEYKVMIEQIPNFILTASYGGRCDNLIKKHNLRSAIVIADAEKCQRVIDNNLDVIDGLPIDHDDSHAADPLNRNQSFALLVHGTQPKGSEAAKSLKILKGTGSYGR